MKKHTSIRSRALCCVLALALLSGCSSSGKNAGSSSKGGNSSAPPSGEPTGYQDTIVYCPKLDFITQDMHHTVSMVTKSAYLWVYNTLVELDVATQQIVPALATDWEQTSDTQWKFTLREGVKFHNGDPFTAEDVKFSYEIGNQGNSATRVEGIQSMEVVDEHTILINLKSPDMDFLYRITAPEVSMLSKHAYDTMAAEEAVKIGTGPYMYDKWEQGDFISFNANHDYWGGAPKTEHLILRYIPEASARLIALQTGEVDIIQEPATIDLNYVAEDPNLRLEQYPSSTVRYLSLNQAKAPFDNEKVRQAIAHAINFDEIHAAVYQGNCTALNNVMHSDNAYYSEVEGFNYDVEKAKQLLAEAGYPNGEGFPTVHYAINTASFHKPVAEYVQQAWKELGVTVSVDVVEWASFLPMRRAGDYEISRNGWLLDYNDPSNIMETVYSSNGNNDAQYNNPEYDEFMDKAAREADPKTRFDYLHQAVDVLMEDMGVIPVAFYGQPYLQNTNIVGSWYAPNGFWYFQYADIQ
ncbi:MAG: ABC transporter substrate-binding protein [Lawsonibacter sp.]